ncbi:integrase core domain-containing protein [Niveibacterium sp. 24ML]|uniref:integrase core domain-containing protein n=1 Tax=Niveibacterium sp. 24ML TaxID=2985512 RepID=UPI003B6383FE
MRGVARSYQPPIPGRGAERCVRLEYFESGKPDENPYVERFVRTLRYEWISL